MPPGSSQPICQITSQFVRVHCHFTVMSRVFMKLLAGRPRIQTPGSRLHDIMPPDTRSPRAAPQSCMRGSRQRELAASTTASTEL